MKKMISMVCGMVMVAAFLTGCSSSPCGSCNPCGPCAAPCAAPCSPCAAPCAAPCAPRCASYKGE